MSINFNDRYVDRLPVPARGANRKEYLDPKVPGFGVRVSCRGRKIFFMQFRFRGKQKRMSLGTYPDVPLAEARGKAYGVLADLKKGVDPTRSQILVPAVGESRLQMEVLHQADAMTFGEAVDTYERIHCMVNHKPSWAREKIRLLRKSFPDRRDQPVEGITRRDIIKVLDGLVEAGRPGAANNACKAIKVFFKWCRRRDYVGQDPAAEIPRPAKDNKKDRFLNETEIVAVLKAARQLGYPFGTIVELLLLTGQRSGEVIGMRWSELDLKGKAWRIPGQRTKNSHGQFVPLTPRVRALLRTVPRGESDFLFPGRGYTDRALTGVSRRKIAFDRLCGIQYWTLHDLRRTTSTYLGMMRIRQVIIDRILNHVVGEMSSVARIYNRFQYEDEVREAIGEWHAYLKRLVKKAS